VLEAAPALAPVCEIIHLTGTGKAIGGWSHPHYHAHEFISDGMKHALAAADVIVSRAGMSALAEIAALGKAAIVVPMSDSHQERNASAFARAGAAIVLEERGLSPPALVDAVRSLLEDADRRRAMGSAAQRVLPLGAAAAVARELAALVPSSPAR
jgi:UDP-N-acetylglucosamine--N-acetylmuramyl-(pentapeptide) pyrophosphoryl-undecaprenol N-acetylglucosamine transferase